MLNFPLLSVPEHGFCSKPPDYTSRIAKFGALVPTIENQKWQCLDGPRILSFSGNHVKVSNFGWNELAAGEIRINLRKRGFNVWAKSTLNVVKVVESAGGGRREVDRNKEFDAIVIGSGIGGLVASTQLAVKGARVLVLEKYVIPGGSSGFYQRDGYTFDVGSSVMFGFSDKVSF